MIHIIKEISSIYIYIYIAIYRIPQTKIQFVCKMPNRLYLYNIIYLLYIAIHVRITINYIIVDTILQYDLPEVDCY